MTECTYCEQDLQPYDTVLVDRETDDGRTQEGAFCNFGCLSAWLDETEAATDACCRIDV